MNLLVVLASDGLGSRRSLSCHHSCLLGSLSALCLLLTLTCVALSVSCKSKIFGLKLDDRQSLVYLRSGFSLASRLETDENS